VLVQDVAIVAPVLAGLALVLDEQSAEALVSQRQLAAGAGPARVVLTTAADDHVFVADLGLARPASLCA